MEQYKTCTQCKQVKTASEFTRMARLKSGLSSECKVCKAKRDANYRIKNKEKIAMRHKQWAKSNKDHVLSKTYAWRNENPEKYKASQQKSAIKNRDKKRIYNAKWSAENKDLHKAMIADWQKRNPESKRRSANKRRATINQAKHEFYTDADVLTKYGSLCHLCEKPIDLSAPRRVGTEGWQNGLHIDHVVPIYKNGTDTLDNVRPAHAICNLKKGHR